MSRFLARALATVRAEVAPIARLAPVPDTPAPSFGDFGGFGERGEKEKALPSLPSLPAPAWPDGVDWWLTCDAMKLAGIVNTGGTYRWCPTGGLDMWRPDGRYVGFGPHKIAALRAAGLLSQAR